ncbi:MAG: hypothetical protein Q7S89_00225 [bacterium]|nr:hypothetical protein [bacterium]
MKRFWIRSIEVMLCGMVMLGTSAPVFAFDPNLIVSDMLVEDARSMGLSDIQNFLIGKNSLLARFIDVDIDGVIKTAAEVISRAANEYRISPKTILVTLQKEQSLIEDQDVSVRQLDWATGYGVCDSCSTDHPKIQALKGFAKQVDAAAWQFRRYLDNPEVFKIKPLQSTTIDGEIVVPANRATAGLYNYTPHLHGNKNFSAIWQRYFGDPLEGTLVSAPLAPVLVSVPSAQYMGQSTAVVTLDEGASGTVTFTFKNTGSVAWTTNGAVRVALADAAVKEKIPSVADNQTLTFASPPDVRIAGLQESEVLPGAVGTFVWNVEGDAETDVTRQAVVLVWGDRGWMPGTDASFTIVVNHPGFAAGITDVVAPAAAPGAVVPVTLKLVNRGKWDWTPSTFTLELPTEFRHSSWTTPTGSFRMREKLVKKGETASFAFTVKIPNRVGDLPITLTPKLGLEASKRVEKELGKDAPKQIAGFPADITARVDAPLKGKVAVNSIPAAVKVGWKPQGVLHIENTGTQTWKGIELRSTDLKGMRSPFYHPEWISSVVVARSNVVVTPGKSLTMLFPLSAPLKAGTYTWAFSLNTKGARIYLDGELAHDQTTRVDR